jgi:RNA polymerase sigma-70 factor (ECF subfamily)
VSSGALPARVEDELVARAREGREHAWRALFERDREMVYRVGYRILLSREDALDVVQETFCKAFQGLDGLRDDAGWTAWLRKIAVNTAISRLRERKGVIHRLGRRDNEHATDGIMDRGGNARTRLQESEMARAFRAALDQLSPQQRAVLALHFEEGLSGPEIAEVLRIRPGTVRSHLFRARQHIQKRLERFLSTGERS